MTAIEPGNGLDLLLRRGSVVDGSGAPGRVADVLVRGDRIVEVGDLAALDPGRVARVVEVAGRIVCPGFIDPHGHSDASLLLDGALISHLAQGVTTQLSGNCGASLAPVTETGRELIEREMGDLGGRVPLDWTGFADYLARVESVDLGPNVAFLEGHGTIRGAVIGPSDRAPDDQELAAMVRHLEEALDAGAIGLSSGLIYAPGIYAGYWELAALVAPVARRGALYATHMRNESAGLFDALAEAVAVAWGEEEGPARLQVSHLKAGARSVWGRAGEAVEFLEAARRDGLDVAADQYPYTAAATTLAAILPPDLLALPVDETVARLRDPAERVRARRGIAEGSGGWENMAADPGWAAIRITEAPGHRDWQGRTVPELADELGRDPVDVAFDLLADERLDVGMALECMLESDVETIMAVDWVAVCTDATGRRPGHPQLGAGVPHPRTYGTYPRVLRRYVRERGVLPLERAIAKMTSLPAERLGLARRGRIEPGWAADLVVFDPATIADTATVADPHRLPEGIELVVVNGAVAIEAGRETGARPGRLLRRGE